MSKADKLRISDYLEHILEAIERIDRYTQDMNEDGVSRMRRPKMR